MAVESSLDLVLAAILKSFMADTSKSNGQLGGRPDAGGSAMPLDQENKQQVDTLKREHAQRQKVGDDLSKYLKRLSDDIEALDREKRLSLFRQQLKAHKYFDGNFFGYVDANCEWKEAKREEGEVWYSDNQLYPYLRTAMMELSRTQTEVVINANSQSEKAKEIAKFAKSRYDANRERTFSALKKQTEKAYGLLNGITYRYTFFQFEGRPERVPKLVKRDIDDEPRKIAYCSICGRQRQEADAPDVLGAEYVEKQKCQCGSELFTEAEDSAGRDPDVVIGYDDVKRGENDWTIPNPISVIVSMQAASMPESTYVKWKQLVLRSVLEHRFPGMDLPSTGNESLELRYITDQQQSTPGEGWGTLGRWNDSQQSDSKKELELLEFHQVWLDYAVYCNKTFDTDQPLSDGRVLKANQPMGELWDKGLYFAKVGDVILDTWNEDKNKKWTSSPYGLRPGSMYGTGSSVALQDQETLNDFERLKMSNAWNNGVPREFVDPSIIPELSADPAIPTNFTGEVGMRDVIGRAYQQAPATPLSPEIYGIVQEKKDNIQAKTGAMSAAGGGGLADAQKWGDTATAISIKRDLAVGRFTPDLELMADLLDREQAYQFLENEQQYFTPAQWAELKGENGAEAVEGFLDCDIRRDLNITIAPGSTAPRTEAQMQSKMMAVAQIIVPLMETGNQELVAYALEVFGMPEKLGIWNADRIQANIVIGRFKPLCDQFVEQFGDLRSTNLEDPMVLKAVELVDQHANAPVDYFLDNHEAMINAYRDLRATDEGREWSNLLTATVSRRVLEHQAGIAKQQAMLARTAMAAEEPMREQAKADQNEQLQLQAVQTEQQNAAGQEEAQMQMLDKAVEYNDRDESRRADAEERNAQREHEKELKAAEILANAEAPKPDTPARR